MTWMREKRVGRRISTQFMLSTGPVPYAHMLQVFSLSSSFLLCVPTPMAKSTRFRARKRKNHTMELMWLWKNCWILSAVRSQRDWWWKVSCKPLVLP